MPRPELAPGELGHINTTSRTANGMVRARARYRDHAGNLNSLEAVGKTEADAARNLRARVRAWQPPDAKTDFSTLAADWLTHLTQHQATRPQSADRYQDAVTHTLAPLIGARAIGSLRAPDMQRVLDTIHATKPGSYGTCITVCKGVLDHAVRSGALQHSPMTSVYRHMTKVATTPRVLETDELAELRYMVRQWQTAPRRTHPLLDIIDLALSTGARISELLALTWHDVDLHNRTITLAGTQVWVRGQGILRQADTKESVRLKIKLTNFAHLMLTERRREHPDDVYVFQSRAGTMITRANLGRSWRSARGEKYKWVTWRTFRKSVATLVANTADSATAAQVLGHTSDRVTRRHYIVNDHTAVPDATAILEALSGESVLSFDDDDD